MAYMIQKSLAMVVNKDTCQDEPLDCVVVNNNDLMDTVDYMTSLWYKDIKWIRELFPSWVDNDTDVFITRI